MDGAMRDGLVAEMDRKAEEKVVELENLISVETDVVILGNLRYLHSTLVTLNSKMGRVCYCEEEDSFLEEQMKALRAREAVTIQN